MKNKPNNHIKVERPFQRGNLWVEASSTYIAVVDFGVGRRTEYLRLATRTKLQKRRVVEGLRSVADFLERKMDRSAKGSKRSILSDSC
jgi:hypothetical protein